MRQRIKLYDKRSWRRRARLQLIAEPICRVCGIEPAVHCDHIEPHRGDKRSFFLGATQALCLRCHALKTQEKRGYRVKPEIGLDGFPIDDRSKRT
jgi:hypothetical protein